ncbi:hypothetical protein [Nonomuraea sp. SYSU D8015]|uniref:hypothetical protein n=1 Tax=Nonomuraea sp. SYSU D8015 TaxID=2593644 RepID=UPI0016600FD0|nr:hypothetical protein [Nonomuraea sp. SYSU D8015]
MRGQEPGSEHDRREADDSARPATPPPSFGRTDGRDAPPPFAPAEEADNGETRSVVPVLKGPPPGLPKPDDAQPWEVPGDDAAPYDWFADHADTDPTLARPAPLPRANRRPLNASPTGPTGFAPAERPPADSAVAEPTASGTAPASSGPWPAVRAPLGSVPAEGPTTGPSWAGQEEIGPEAADHPQPGHWQADRSPLDQGPATRPHPGLGQADPPQPDHGQTRELRAEQAPRTDTPWAPQAPGAAENPWAAQGQAAETPADRAQAEPVDELPPWPVEPVVPGAPPWDPPPAFTAAAAGMPVWPGPVSDPHAMPPWPAATGELVAEPDEPDTPAFDPNATEPEGITRPAHYFDPEAARREAAQASAPDPAAARSGITWPEPATPQEDTPTQATAREATAREAIEGPSAAAQEAATREATARQATAPASAAREDAAPASAAHEGEPEESSLAAQDTPQEGAPDEGHPAAEGASQDATQQRTTVPLSAPVAQEREDTRPISHEETAHPGPKPLQQTKQPAHYFDPKAAKRDQPPTHPTPLYDPNGPTPAPIRPPEPGDVPVWPPLPPAGSQKLPDLPFARESWGQRPSTALDLPTPPQGSGPAFPPGAFKQPPFQTPPPPPPPGKSKRALLVTLGALALAGVATGGFFAYQAVTNPSATTTAARGGSSTPSAQPTEEPEATPTDVPGASVLNSEQTDPQKLSLSEAFPKKKVSAAGTTFTRVKADMETTCDKAATGAFAEALKEQKCSRVLRATYVDSKRRYAVTTGIAVLPTKEAAEAADQAKNLDKNVWFRPLPGPDGSGGERVHIAGGYAAGLVWGRYIVFSYATHADGHTPETKEKTLPKVSSAFRDQTSLVLERRVTNG